MGEYLDQVPEKLHDHIRQITKTSHMPDTDESVEAMAKGWLDKQAAFQKKLDELNMEEVDEFGADEERGAIVLTYSGSILNIGPITDGVRHADYLSIGLREDVPESATSDESVLAGDITRDDVVSFDTGPIQKSSPIYTIAVNRDAMEPEEEVEKLTSATQVLADEFVEINKTVSVE